MKAVLFFIGCLLVLQITAQLPAQGTMFPSNCTLSNPNDTLIYEWDSKRFAMLRAFQLQASYNESMDFHQPTIDSIARVFYLIHNLPNSPLKDTLRNLFAFSNFTHNSYQYIPNSIDPPISPESDSSHIFRAYVDDPTNSLYYYYTAAAPFIISLDVPTTESWAIAWSNGNYTNTNNTEMNNIGAIPWLNKMVLNYGAVYHIILRANYSHKFNPLGLVSKLNRVLGYPIANTVQYAGDGNAIQINFETDGIKITYQNGCGDCGLGCLYGRFWTFKTFFDNCNVQYLNDGSFGNPPPNLQGGCLRANSPTPVKFIDFFAKQNINATILHWLMGEEINFSHYAVEMSTGNNEFSTIGKVLPNTEKRYNYAVTTPLYTATKFRIKAVDKDGSVMYSKQVEVKPNVSDKTGFTISPNPVTGRKINIQSTSAQSGNYNFVLTNTSGKKVLQQSIYIASGANATIELNANIISGIYIAQLITKDNTVSLGKIIVR